MKLNTERIHTIWHLTWPQCIMLLCQFVIGITDVWAGGRIGSEVQASIGLITQCHMMFMALAMAAVSGAVASISQSLGACKFVRARRYVGLVTIEETPGQWEYLYTQEALSTLAGNKLHKKKNHVNGYMKAYGEDYRTLNGEIMPQVLALQDDWCKWRECEKSASLLAESDVVCSVLRNWDALPGLIGGALYAGEEMAAFAVGEPLDDQTIVVHFEKGRPGYRGVYQAINFCFAKYAAKNFVFINREQDADEEGLRQAKESYMPSGYLKKNTIRIVN